MYRTPGYKRGDKVRVRLDSTSPYKGRIGIVKENTLKEEVGFLYVVEFEWVELARVNRFIERDPEGVTASG